MCTVTLRNLLSGEGSSKAVRAPMKKRENQKFMRDVTPIASETPQEHLRRGFLLKNGIPKAGGVAADCG